MSDDQVDYGDFEDDVGLEAEGKQYFGQRQEWLKMTKGQKLRASFLYFHTADINAVNKARKAAKDEGKTLSREEMQAIGTASLEELAKGLEKTLDQLTLADKLDFGTVHFKKMNAHYQQGLGYVISRLGKDGPESDAVWGKLEEAKLYFASLLLLYPTDGDGNLDKEGIKAGKWRVIPWRFGKNTYENIWKLNDSLRENNLSIANQDLKLECKDAQYQNISVSSAGPALWQKSENFKKLVLEKALPFYDKLIPFREMTTDALRAKLGLGGSAVQDVTSSEEFEDLLSNV